MIDSPEAVRASVKQRFVKIARSLHQEQKFPIGLASAKKSSLGS